MHSIKNTIVAVILLGVSYGVYQVITTPHGSTDQSEMLAMVSINDKPDQVQQDSAVSSQRQLANDSFPSNDAAKIPSQLLKDTPRLPAAGEFDNALGQPNNEFSARSLTPGKSGNSFPPAGSSELADSAGSGAGRARSTAPPFLDVRQPNDAQERDKNLIDALKNEISDSTQFDADSFVGSPKSNLTNVTPRPTDTDAGKLMFDPRVAPASTSTVTLAAAWPKIEAMVSEGQFRQALSELTQHYRSPGTPADQRQKLLNWLDLLAAKVIYSSEHHLQSTPYIIQPGDEIAHLARKWLVPAQLIYNINRRKISDPNELVPGTELKMVQGPFHAEVDSRQGVMTLYLEQMYAGRFTVRTGGTASTGEFRIVDKSARDKQQMPYWIGLSNGANVYAAERATVGGADIGLSQQEAADVFAILSASSKVTVLR